MRCTVMDHAVTRFDELFRERFRASGAPVPPTLYPFLSEPRVRERREFTARVLFGGDRRAQALAMKPAVTLIFSELLRFPPERSDGLVPGPPSVPPERPPRLKTGPATLVG
jgi:hypothetical protein